MRYVLLIIMMIVLIGREAMSQEFPDSTDIFRNEPKETKANYDSLSAILSKYKLALIYLKNDSIKGAEACFSEYLRSYAIQNDSLKMHTTLIEIGDNYEERSFFSLALKYYLKAIELSSNESQIKKSELFSKIGLIYYDLKDYTKAYYYFNKSKDIAIQYGLLKQLGAAYINIGEVYRFQGNYDKALDFYNRALEINQGLNDSLSNAIIYNNMALVYLKQKKHGKAYLFFRKSKEIIIAINDQEKLSAINNSFGDYYYSIKSYNRAIESYKKTLEFDIVNIANRNIIYRDAFEGLYLAYLAISDYKKAYYYFYSYSLLNEKILSIENQKQIVEIEFQHIKERHQQEIQFLEKVSENERIVRTKQAIVFIVILTLLFFLVVLIYYVLTLRIRTSKQKREILEKEKVLVSLENEKRKSENIQLIAINKELEASEIIARLKQRYLTGELEHKKRELASQALHMGSKNDMLNGIKENLLKTDFLAKNKSAINTIIREIDNNIDIDSDWKLFKMHFEEIHPDFFIRLKELNSDITNDELKLCAYLRINLSSKEIAQLLNITTVAINKRRNRLRKKLNIDSEVDLYQFISKV